MKRAGLSTVRFRVVAIDAFEQRIESPPWSYVAAMELARRARTQARRIAADPVEAVWRIRVEAVVE